MSKLFINPSSITWGSEHVVGDVFEVEVLISDVKDCYGVQFGLEWDSSVLELAEDPVKGDFLEASGVSTWWFPYSEAGYVLCGYMRFEAPSGVDISAAENGLVATLKFKALKPMPSTSNIAFIKEECTWFNSAFTEHDFDVLNGAVFMFGVVPPLTYPKMIITDLTVPTTASQGEAFEVYCDWWNDGEAGKAYTRILDVETGLEVSPRTEFEVLKGQSGTLKYILTMPNKDLRLKLEIGHVE